MGVLATAATLRSERLKALLASTIKRLFGDRFALLETGLAIARRVQALLAADEMSARPGALGRVE